MGILDLLFPKRCVHCKWVGNYLCPRCENKIEYIYFQICPVCGRNAVGGRTHPRCRNRYSLDGLYAIARYTGPVRSLIHALKYRLSFDTVHCMAGIISRRYPAYLPHFDCLVPIPLFWKRERMRGFNQSRLIAEGIGKMEDIPVKELLIRIRDTGSQAELTLEERRKNIRDAFSCAQGKDPSGKKILLIDDVTTTRSTVMECAKALKKQGAGEVWGFALAHG